MPVLAAACSLLALGGCAATTTSEPGGSATSYATTPAPTASATSGAPASSPASAAATPTGSAAATNAPAEAGPPCTSAQVGISLTGTGAAAGHEGGFLTFTNHGSSACTVTGFPAVTAITAAGKATVVPSGANVFFAGWNMPSPRPVVSLAPGQSAYAALDDTDLPVGSETSCPPPYAKLQVAIPGGAPATISAWLPGAGAYLPGCLTTNGAPEAAVSAIGPASDLPTGS
ncbi:MAG TPA: DUF4232 domain-containing protein [Trebonia sp.]